MTNRVLFPHVSRLQFDSDEGPLPLPPVPRSSRGYLSEIDAPYVRYSPPPSSSSSSTVSEFSSASSDHHSVVENPQVFPIPTVNLPHHRAVCNICLQDFQTYHAGQIESLEPLRKFHCTHVFHEECIIQTIAQSTRGDQEDNLDDDSSGENFRESFECPTCRRSVGLRQDSHDGPSELAHPSSHLFSESSPRPLLTRPPALGKRARHVDSVTSSEAPNIPLHESQNSPGSPTQIPLIRDITERSGSKSPVRSDISSDAPQRPRGPPSATEPGILSPSHFSHTARSDQPHLCRLWNPLRPTNSIPRRPYISEETAPRVGPHELEKTVIHPTPDMDASTSVLKCAKCSQPLVPAELREGKETTRSSPEIGKSDFRKAPCGHFFHADCLDFLIPLCECQLPAGAIECPSCAHPIPLKSRGLDSVGAMANDPDTLPANIPSTWFRELLMDHQLLTSSQHSNYLKRLLVVGRSQRFLFKLQSVFSGRPHFREFLQEMQDKGAISLNAGTIRGPEGLWGHYIIVSSVKDSALRENVVGRAIWGVQMTEEEAKDAAALKVLHQLGGNDPILE